MLAREQWGKGLATEAAVALREHAFRKLSLPWLAEGRVERVISLIRPENHPSRGVAENIGMTVWKETLHGSTRWPHLVYRVRGDDLPTG
jgi:RimJ/RimL family protein N-acetyltransferase